MTAKDLRKERVIDCTRGLSREQRAINRRNRLAPNVPEHSTDGSKHLKSERQILKEQILKRCKEEDAARNYCRNLYADMVKHQRGVLPKQAVTGIRFDEKPFGEPVVISADTEVLSCIVVSIALFDGNKMLFACSGIPLSDRAPTQLHLTKFVTSACLAREFNDNRYTNDGLTVKVRLPYSGTVTGFLGLYDEDIAIVTSMSFLNVHPVNLDDPVALDLPADYVSDDNCVLAVGYGFESGSLMAAKGSLDIERPSTWVSGTQNLSEAVLGGPLIGKGAKFLGMNSKCCGGGVVTFLSQKFLHERLKHFQILNRKKLHFRGYSYPKGVSRIVPSVFFNLFHWLKCCGYPMPPPLVLECNGDLLNKFEEFFGEIIAWKDYPFGGLPGSLERGVWKQLPQNVVTDVSQSVVSVTSFDGDGRYFVCTGLIIKWPMNSTLVLTSASLVRSRNDEDEIESNLRIRVFLPPDEYRYFSGTLEWYSLRYNIAIVSLPENLEAISPAEIFNKVQESSGNVVAIGRDPERGLLMASCGEVKYRKKDVKLFCKDLRLSTCKIKKAGIGGPLINMDGSFVGMNFYDGREVTPFLPQSKIQEVLSRAVGPLPSESDQSEGRGHALDTCGGPIRRKRKTKKDKWPVPEAYWYFGPLQRDRYYVPKLPGRHLD